MINNKDKQLHKHSGHSSKGLLDADKILKEIGLSKGNIFLDIGCGKGYFSLAASKIVGAKGRVYALDIHKPSITVLKTEVNQKQINNIEAYAVDVTQGIFLKDKNVDVCLMANVLHGFTANGEVDMLLKEIDRVLKKKGSFAVVDFKKIASSIGPRLSIRLSEPEVKKIVMPYGFKSSQSIAAGIYHYTVIFYR